MRNKNNDNKEEFDPTKINLKKITLVYQKYDSATGQDHIILLMLFITIYMACIIAI